MTKTRVALYVRVSTQEQVKEGYSIGEQTERLQMYAEAHGWHVYKIYTDAGHSGATKNRPALQDLITDIKHGKVDKVLVYKLDRLSRSQKDTLALIEDVMLANHCDFVSMSENFDTGTPFGMAIIGILAVFAQLEREQIKERLMLGKEARVKEGKWCGVAPPFGYTYDGEKLIINEYEAMIVRYIFDAFIHGMPLRKLSDQLDEKGYAFRNGRSDYSMIKYILANKVYCGYMRHNDEWINGLHDPIIDDDTFAAAQKILDYNRKRYFENTFKPNNLAVGTNLGGLIYCARCGAKFGKRHTGSKKYGLHYQYCCYSRSKTLKVMIKDPNCMNKAYNVEDLDDIIFSEIKKLAIDPEYIKTLHQPNNDDDKAIDAIQKQIKQISTQLSRYMDLYSLGTYSIDDLDAKTAPLQDQRTKLSAELERLTNGRKKLPEADAIHLATSFEDVLDHGDLTDRRKIIEALIDKIIIDGDDITIHWNF